jgi:hypothetical protein
MGHLRFVPRIHRELMKRQARSRATTSLEEFLVFKELNDEKGSMGHDDC